MKLIYNEFVWITEKSRDSKAIQTKLEAGICREPRQCDGLTHVHVDGVLKRVGHRQTGDVQSDGAQSLCIRNLAQCGLFSSSLGQPTVRMCNARYNSGQAPAASWETPDGGWRRTRIGMEERGGKGRML